MTARRDAGAPPSAHMLDPVASLLVLAIVSLTPGGCAWVGGCAFDEASYPQLRRGMSHDDVTRLTGCSGMRTSPPAGKPKESVYRSWASPRGPVTIEFQAETVESWRITNAKD